MFDRLFPLIVYETPADGGSAVADPSANGAAVTEPPADPSGTPPAGQQPEAPATDDPFGDYRPALESLMEPLDPSNPDAGTGLDATLNLLDILHNPERREDLERWWGEMGDEMGFFDAEEGGDGEGDGEDVNLDDMPAWARKLQEDNQRLQEQIQGREQESMLQQAQNQISADLDKFMAANDITDDPSVPEAQRDSVAILRLATAYGSDPQAIEKAGADFLRLTGRKQADLVRSAGAQTTPLNGGRPGPVLDGGSPDTHPDHPTSWKDARSIALQRLQGAG